jgi:hypothetical protein
VQKKVSSGDDHVPPNRDGAWTRKLGTSVFPGVAGNHGIIGTMIELLEVAPVALVLPSPSSLRIVASSWALVLA